MASCEESVSNQNGHCRYFVRGECREGSSCRFSHDPDDVPICHYYLEGRCLFGADCWYKHPVEPEGITSSLDPSVPFMEFIQIQGGRLNLLLAAAITTAPSAEDSSSEEEDQEPREEMNVTEALELWAKYKAKDESKSGSDVCDDWLEEKLHKLFSDMRKRDVTAWDVNSILTFLTTIHRFDMQEFDQYDILTSKSLGETLSSCKTTPTVTGELFLKLAEDCGTDLKSLVLTLCNARRRLKAFERHIAAILLAAENKDTSKWTADAVGALLQSIEDNGFNVDVTEIFYHMGKDQDNPTKLGSQVRSYLLATGSKDSFECKCQSPECECPVEIDEGIAYITFAGLEQKMNWDQESKNKFFKTATESLFSTTTMKELGNSMGIKEPLKVGNPRPNKKSLPQTRPLASGTPTVSRQDPLHGGKVNANKCHGEKCSNQPKKGCDNSMCGRCCRKSQTCCSVHEPDIFQHLVPDTCRVFRNPQPIAHFKSRDDITQFAHSNKRPRSLVFGPDFHIRDDDVIKAVDLWKEDLMVLELGSSDTGDGVWLTDKTLRCIADNCPHLCKLRLESVTGATDAAVIEIANKCPLLEDLTVSGHDKSTGALTDKFLKVLFDVNVLPRLSYLSVTDQWGIKHDVVFRLRRRRPKLKIVAGQTDSDSYAHSIVLGMMGLDYGDGLY